MNLDKKVALVTGSSSGIGQATAIALAKKGAKVVVTYHNTKKGGEETYKECKKHTEAILIQLDVSDEKSIQNAVKQIAQKFGKLDILVNNAGVLVWEDFAKHTMKDIDFQIQTNLTGLIKMTHASLPHLSKEAIIINIASEGGKKPFQKGTIYCATKFGVRGFTQALAMELPKGIKTFAINPGLTATRMTDYEGVPPEKVADVIIKAVEEKLKKKSGDDVDVLDYI